MTVWEGTTVDRDVRRCLFSLFSSPDIHSLSWHLRMLDAKTVYSDTKVVVGTQIGVLSIFNRNSGWGDCVDRVPGYVCPLTILMTLLHNWHLDTLIQ
jgi:hypothetical protein